MNSSSSRLSSRVHFDAWSRFLERCRGRLYWVGRNRGGFYPFKRFRDSFVRGDCFTEGAAKDGIALSYEIYPVSTLLVSYLADTILLLEVDFFEYFFLISSSLSFFSFAIFSSSSLLITVEGWSDFNFCRLPLLYPETVLF